MVAPLSGVIRDAALAGRAPRRRSWRFRLAVALSVLFHLAVLVALLVSFRREELPELLPPPSPVTMVFESGRKSGPTLPNPSEQATPSQPAPAEPPAPPAEQEAPPPPPTVKPPPPAPAPLPPPTPAPPAPLPPAPVLPAPPPAAPVPSQSPPLAPVTPTPTVPAAPAAPQPETKVRPPAPGPAPQAIPTPAAPQAPAIEALPPPPAAPPPIPRLAQPTPLPVKPSARPSPRSAPPTAFPPPMNYSFGAPVQPPERPRSMPRPRGSIDLSLGPAARGQADVTPFGPHAHDAAVADWSNELSRWVSEHAYYPPEAIRQLEEGDSKVHVVMQPNGRVTSVELVGRSGSIWLDTALLSLFRDQHLPPLPPGENGPFDFDFTMRYILRRLP